MRSVKLFAVLLFVFYFGVTSAYSLTPYSPGAGFGPNPNPSSQGSFSGPSSDRQETSPVEIMERESAKKQLWSIENELRMQNGKTYFNEKQGQNCRDRGALGFYVVICD